LPLTRRGLLGAAATALATTAAAKAGPSPDTPDVALGLALDAAAAEPEPDQALAIIEALKPNGLSESARLDLDSAKLSLRTQAALAARFPFGRRPGEPYIVSPAEGAWRDVAKADTPARAAALVRAIDSETARIAHDAQSDVILPSVQMDKTIKALALAATSSTTQDLKAALGRQAAKLEDLRARAGAGVGVGRFKDGDAYYALLLELNLGETLSPSAAHALAWEEARRVSAKADILLKAEGLSLGSVADRLRALVADPRWLYSDDDVGRDQAVSDMNRRLAVARARLPRDFANLPTTVDTIQVRRMSASDEAAGRQGYRELPSSDGRPGVYVVDLREIRRRPSWSLPTVVHHETLPGHLLQMPLEAISGAHPLRRRSVPALMEGWAIYAEQLADEDGAYADNRRARIGYLQSRLFRLGRIIMDTGLHHEGWSLEHASAVMNDLQGDAPIYAAVPKDLDRICLQPAAYAGQGLWTLEFERIRRAFLHGDRPENNPRAFHRLALDLGPTPLSLFEAKAKTRAYSR
jgi:uncharacterized protein (DUF885 family)